DAVGAKAVVTIEVVGDKAVGTAADAGLDPCLEDRAPTRIIETRPVFLHAADGILVVDDRFAVRAALEQFQQVRGRPGAEFLLVAEVAEVLEEAARPFRAIGVADEELDVEMADDLHSAPVQLSIEVFKIPAALAECFPRELAMVPGLVGGRSV